MYSLIPSSRTRHIIHVGCLFVFLGSMQMGLARTIEWAGRPWHVKQGIDLPPGGNDWSDSVDNVWVDGSGNLHLKLTEDTGTWSSAEIIGLTSLGYGEYRFRIESRVDQFDPNIVAGLFTFLDDDNEIDIEFARAFFPLGSPTNAQFSTQPAAVPGNGSPFVLDQSQSNQMHTTHRFIWEPDEIFYESYYSHLDPPVNSNDIIHSFTYTNSAIPSAPASEKVHVNLWLFDGTAPSNTQTLELVVRDFEFTPSPLAAGTSAVVSVSATVVEGTDPFLEVDATNSNFGVVNFSANNHRFQSGVMTCRFFPPNAWSIRVGSDNLGDVPGLLPIDSNGNQMVGLGFIPLKFNQPNFGPGDPEDDVNWTGTNSVWRGLDDFEGRLSPPPAEFASSASLDAAPEIKFRFAIDIEDGEATLLHTNYMGKVVFDLGPE